MSKTNPLRPSPALLSKLGSIIVHAEELISEGGHEFDFDAIKALLANADVQEWIKAMTDMAMLPVKR